MNRSSVSARIGSAPLNAILHELRFKRGPLLRRDLANAQVVGEIRAAAGGAPEPRDRRQPAKRLLQKRHRGHHHIGNPDIQRLQNAADQAHVVVARQPEHAGAPSGVCSKQYAISAALCIRLPWVSTTPFGRPVDPDVYCRNASVCAVDARRLPRVFDARRHVTRDHPVQAAEHRRVVDQRPNPIHDRVGRQGHFRAGVFGDRLQATVELVAPRRIHRHGHDLGVQTAEERGDKLQARRIAQQGPAAGQILRFQPRPDRPGLPIEFPVRHLDFLVLAVHQPDKRHLVGLMSHAVAQQLHEVRWPEKRARKTFHQHSATPLRW